MLAKRIVEKDNQGRGAVAGLLWFCQMKAAGLGGAQ